MVEYIYFVKCLDCEDEHFDFFDEAKCYAMRRLGQKPIITQTEVCRNDFGECTDHSDLGTIWSWEDLIGKDFVAEPVEQVFTKDDLKNLPVDNDPEFDDDDFYFMNNTIAEDYSRRVSFKSKAAHDEFMKLCSEIGIITGEDLDHFMVDHKADDSNLLDKLRACRDELGTDFKLKESTEEHDSLATNKRGDYLTRVSAGNYAVFNRNNVWLGTIKSETNDEAIERFNRNKLDEARKPIPEGMTIEQLVEEMEENEDAVECTWCNDLFDKSECHKEVDLGWLCSRCEAAIKSRGEPLTFRENDYWDFLDEDTDKSLSEGFNPKDKVALEYDKLTITVVGNQRDVDDWDEAEHTAPYTYEASKDEVANAIWENFLTDEDVADVPGGIEALEDNTAWYKFLETNFDKLFDEYYDELLEYFEARAIKEFEHTYSWDDYKAERYSESCTASEQESHLDILEEDAEYSKRLTVCPECGDGFYDHETGFCINCGFN